MDWSADGWRSAFRIELRVQAIGFASRGWPVLPGTYPVESGWMGLDGTEVDGPRPVHEDWQSRLGMTPDEVTSCWADRPYSLLVATGTALEALEVDATLGRRAAVALREQGVPVPIVAVPDGRWYFLTAAGQSLPPELSRSGRVRLHSTGSWLPMPPSPYLLAPMSARQHGHQGVVHWRVKPEVCNWRLPAAQLVQEALWVGLDVPESMADLVTAGT